MTWLFCGSAHPELSDVFCRRLEREGEEHEGEHKGYGFSIIEPLSWEDDGFLDPPTGN